MPSDNIYSIAPTTPFLPCLAKAIMAGEILPDLSREGPFWLSDITIYIPTKRARLGLVDAFLTLNGGSQLLPNIFTLGEGDDAENAFFTDPDVQSHKVATKTYRTAILSRLVAAWAQQAEAGFSSPPTLVEILAMAQSLGTLIDDFHTEEVSGTALNDLVPTELAKNWQQNLAFLKIAFEAWPEHLNEIGEIDGAELRRQRFDIAARSLALRYANRPVIAAGSTGSVPATARFLKAIAQLPQGAIVLPGLDMDISANEHEALINPAFECHAHPQFGIAHLLRTLNCQVPRVNELSKDGHHIRRQLLNASLARPEQTAQWHQLRQAIDAQQLKDALAHVKIYAAANPDTEARAIAIATREAVETGKNVGIISPDRDLARRIRAELERFGIKIDDSAGMPLHQAPAGRWLRQILVAVQSNFAPVDLMSLLANRHITLGRSRMDISRMRELLDIKLMRGVRNVDGLEGYKRLLAEGQKDDARSSPSLSPKECEELIELLDEVQKALAPLIALIANNGSIAKIAACIPALLGNLYHADAAQMAQFLGAKELLAWALELAQHKDMASHHSASDLMASLTLLMQNVTVRPAETTRQDVQIWGRIEARLLQPDVMILAGMNEGVWPEVADPGPWLSRGMKLAINLDPPERKVGLAAHDFLMAMGANEVLLTYARRRGTSPADISRFIQRFVALIGEAASDKLYQRAQYLERYCLALDVPEKIENAKRPMPNPAAKIRPRRLSITEIETLLRDPYAIYAKHVLALRKLRPLGEPPDTAERGTLIHDVLALFVQQGHDFTKPDAHDILMQLADFHYQRMDDAKDKKHIWLRRFSLIAEHVINYERQRDADISTRFAEKRGETSLKVANGAIELFGYADRIDRLADKGVEIIDFKTGSVPPSQDMQQLLAPQLPMEALIAMEGGFEGVEKADIEALTYLKLSHGPNPLEIKKFATGKRSLADLVEDYQLQFSAFAEMMLLGDKHPMAAQLMPKENQQFAGDYDHLARQKEWMIDFGDEE